MANEFVHFWHFVQQPNILWPRNLEMLLNYLNIMS